MLYAISVCLANLLDIHFSWFPRLCNDLVHSLCISSVPPLSSLSQSIYFSLFCFFLIFMSNENIIHILFLKIGRKNRKKYFDFFLIIYMIQFSTVVQENKNKNKKDVQT